MSYQKSLSVTKSGLMSLFLVMLLASCVTVRTPSADYLKDCVVTYPPDRELTNGDVVQLAKDREFDLKVCNLDKAALRAWYEAQCRGAGRKCKAG